MLRQCPARVQAESGVCWVHARVTSSARALGSEGVEAVAAVRVPDFTDRAAGGAQISLGSVRGEAARVETHAVKSAVPEAAREVSGEVLRAVQALQKAPKGNAPCPAISNAS